SPRRWPIMPPAIPERTRRTRPLRRPAPARNVLLTTRKGNDMSTMRNLLLGAALRAAATAGAEATRMTDAQLIARGKYVAKIAGCNDCHTPGYAVTGGKVPEKDWLIGDALGWRGDWGTTYPANLRLYMQTMSETQWVKTAQTIQTRPPMPWFALH